MGQNPQVVISTHGKFRNTCCRRKKTPDILRRELASSLTPPQGEMGSTDRTIGEGASEIIMKTSSPKDQMFVEGGPLFKYRLGPFLFGPLHAWIPSRKALGHDGDRHQPYSHGSLLAENRVFG
ncbi:MAG: hypothetical protein CM15mP49_35350 [Actinomycetota bacterium]|nr:MAG: hypothetical protein CM15mP49_35350 [Actinomycetota bacterium]